MARPVTWSTGPWKRVRNTPNPFNNAPDELVAATNIYLQDTVNGSGAFGRWGYTVRNSGASIGTGADGGFIHTHLDAAGNVYTFIIAGQKLYRVDDTLECTCTDVTPTRGVANDHPWMLSFNGYLVVGGDQTKPFIATNLSSTPVTATDIDYDGAGTPWKTRGLPVEYAGSLVFIVETTESVTRIAWSAPGDPATGYEQDPYDFSWDLIAADSAPLNALEATNLALFYFRDRSIGALTGTPATAGSVSGSDFRNSSTQDAISADVGCNAPNTIRQYGDRIFFADIQGRAWMMQSGSVPVPIWQQMESVIEAERGGYLTQGGGPALTAIFASASLFPALGIYLLGNYRNYTETGTTGPPTQLHAFDARTGNYLGEWYLNDGYAIVAQGSMIAPSAFGTERHILIAAKTDDAAPSGADTRPMYLWATGTPYDLTWFDNDRTTATSPDLSVTTPRMGFDAGAILNVDRITAIMGDNRSVTMVATTPQDSVTLAVTPISASTDGTFRAVGGVQLFGRGVTVKVSQTSGWSAQWSIEQVQASGVQSKAGFDDA